MFVSEVHAPNGWLEQGDRVVFRIIEEENRKGRANAQYKAVDVKLVERVAPVEPVATIDGMAGVLSRLQLDEGGLAHLTAEQKASIRAAVVNAKTPAELDALKRQLRGAPAPPSPSSPLRASVPAFVPPPPIESVAAPVAAPEAASALLRRLGLERLAGIFVREELDAEALQVISEDDLVALGVPRADAKLVIAEVAKPAPRESDLERLRQAEAARAVLQREASEATAKLRKASADMEALRAAEAARVANMEVQRQAGLKNQKRQLQEAAERRAADLRSRMAREADGLRRAADAGAEAADAAQQEAERQEKAASEAERLRVNAAKEAQRLRTRLAQESERAAGASAQAAEATLKHEALKREAARATQEADRQRKISKARAESAREAQRQCDEAQAEAERLREEAERLRQGERSLAEEKLTAERRLRQQRKALQETALTQTRELETTLSATTAELARLRESMAKIKGEVPDALCCPISMELMTDPVIAADGHTYERKEITAWFQNNHTSPKTQLELCSPLLIPNHGAKAMIFDYLDKQRQAAIDASMAGEAKGPL